MKQIDLIFPETEQGGAKNSSLVQQRVKRQATIRRCDSCGLTVIAGYNEECCYCGD